MRGTLSFHRVDRDATQRRARAQAHLDRVRRGRGGPIRLRLPRRALAVAAAALVCGAACGERALLFAAGGAGPLERIAVRGAARVSPAQVAEAAGVARGAPLGEVDADRVRESLEQHEWIARARALALPGGALVVEVVEREPLARVSIGRAVYAVDRTGMPFAEIPEDLAAGLVRLAVAGEVAPREPDPRLAEAVRLAGRLPELGLATPSEVGVAAEADPEGYRLALPALPARILLGHTDLDARVDDLARLLAARPDAVAGAASIDLRFANQVVLRSAPARDGPANTAAERGDAPPRSRRRTG
jgi:cell division septal protein FtsQ